MTIIALVHITMLTEPAINKRTGNHLTPNCLHEVAKNSSLFSDVLEPRDVDTKNNHESKFLSSRRLVWPT